MLEEIQSLIASGVPPTAKAFNAHGYKRFVEYITGKRTLESAIEQMKLANVTVVIITHRMGALAATDKIAIMEGGGVVAFGESEEIFERHLSRPQVASQIEVPEGSAAAGGAPARPGLP